jgi:hypothetical protein
VLRVERRIKGFWLKRLARISDSEQKLIEASLCLVILSFDVHVDPANGSSPTPRM